MHYGCIGGLVLVLVMIVGGLLGIYYARKMFNDFTDAEPVPVPQVRLSRAELEPLEGRLEAISIHCAESGQTDKVPAASLFVFIGAEPLTDWLRGVVERDQRGFILTGSDLMHDGKRPQGWTLDRDPYLPETNVPGIFAVGDVRHGSVKRVASGVGEGSIAVQFIHQYLSAV